MEWLDWNEKFIICRKEIASKSIEIMANAVSEGNSLLSDRAKKKKQVSYLMKRNQKI